ncbi:MAG: PilZ domain-containing protein [Spirochaetes bacterium]|nr:PilZ domain-containing protein [Spirochaetota bacterium]
MILKILSLSFNDYFQGLPKAFYDASLNIYLTITAITAIIVIVVIISKIYKYKKRKKLFRTYNEKYKNLITEFGITGEEKKLLKKLTVFLRNPEKKYLLLLDSLIFHSAIEHLRKRDRIKDSLIDDLAVKLRFNNISSYSALRTTHDLPDGMPVYAVINSTLKFYGKVFSSEGYLKIIIKEKPLNITTNSPSIIYTHNNSGIYGFRTQFIKYERNILHFLHSNKFQTSQRRFFFRKEVCLPVYANKIREINDPVSLTMYDLSAGGAVLNNPDLRFKTGDDLIISFSDTQEYLLRLDAEVIRTSKKESIIHVKFSHLKPGIQDRIIRLVNKK